MSDQTGSPAAPAGITRRDQRVCTVIPGTNLLDRGPALGGSVTVGSRQGDIVTVRDRDIEALIEWLTARSKSRDPISPPRTPVEPPDGAAAMLLAQQMEADLIVAHAAGEEIDRYWAVRWDVRRREAAYRAAGGGADFAPGYWPPGHIRRPA